jgi:hypothetical protein
MSSTLDWHLIAPVIRAAGIRPLRKRRRKNQLGYQSIVRADFRNMKIIGIDFTSRPSKSKPLTCLKCEFDNTVLRAGELIEWPSFDGFETFLRSNTCWVAGIDFPFGQPRKFIENVQWPKEWREYVDYVSSIERIDFREILDNYKEPRPVGDKEHRRMTDVAAGSISPQKQYGVPVSLMFYEGTPRLLQSGVTVPGLLTGDPERIVVEAYPGVLAKRLIGRRSYKQDDPKKQTTEQEKARRDLLGKILNGDSAEDYGFIVEAPLDLCGDPTGDRLDALLCAMQAAWAWQHRENNFGAPLNVDPLEGWIADPVACEKMNDLCSRAEYSASIDAKNTRTKKKSINTISLGQIRLACQHVLEMKAAGVTENLSIRTLELFVDVYAKIRVEGSATPHSADQVKLWSKDALAAKNENPNSSLGSYCRVEHGTPRRALARIVLGKYVARQLTQKKLDALVKKHWKLAVISLDEDKRLNKIARAKMFGTPEDRWAAASIEFP